MFFPRLESAATYTSVGVYDGKNMEEKQIYKDDVEVVGQTGGEWVYVGKYTLAKGRDAYVEISNKGSKIDFGNRNWCKRAIGVGVCSLILWYDNFRSGVFYRDYIESGR